jgi:hypothetical protein
MKFFKVENGKPTEPDFIFFCPGCRCDHGIWVKKPDYFGPVWIFNGDLNNPTVTPSLLIRGGENDGICHSFITNGNIQYLNDCTHSLRGQTVELPEYDS